MNIEKLVEKAQRECQPLFEERERLALLGTEHVLKAFQKENLAVRHFAPTLGYGYDDVGRDTLERIFASIFGTEAAIVRPQIASGTHALSLCLFGLLLPGDHLLAASGRPYDTLETVIGTEQNEPGSLREMGVEYSEVPLKEEKTLDLEAIEAAIRPNTRIVAIQRSRGYALRRSLLPQEMQTLAEMLHSKYPNVVLMVDNCYGEFVCEKEPTHYGADICVGSLIKNPGGGLAPTGGYIVGRENLIERISYRLTAPGIGREVGSYAGSYQPFYQGLFMAPHVVEQAIKTAMLASATFGALGMPATPSLEEERSDIILAIRLGTPERVIAFCEGIQMASPVDSMALPQPWDMPGYSDPIIMAAGTFVSGASIELSADAPMRPPYAVYMQGGLTYSHGKLAILRTLRHMQQKGCL